MAVRPVNDPDFWWHLRTGQLILQNHAVFHTDPYSFTRPGQPWINHEWLSELMIYGVYRAGAWAGLILTFAAVTAATLLLVFLRSAGRPYIAAGVTLWAALISAPTWGIRSHTLSLLLASVFLLLIDKAFSRPKLLWWTVPLTLLWVNLHGEYALGAGLLVLSLLGGILDVLCGSDLWFRAKPRLTTLAAVVVACALVVPLNPAGLKMYWYPFETLRSQAMQKYISEWSSPSFHDPSNFPLLLMILAIMSGLALSSRKLRPGSFLFLLVTLALALHSARHTGIFVLVAAPLLSQLIPSFGDHSSRSLTPTPANSAPPKLLANAAILIAFFIFAGVRIRQIVQQQPQAEINEFPARAVAYIERNRPPGPILNYDNWGGYLIWKLYPQCPVFVDGRMDLYGDAFLDDLAAAYYVRTDHWQQDLERWQIRTVLLPPHAPLVSALRLKPEWHQVYTDHLALIMTREK